MYACIISSVVFEWKEMVLPGAEDTLLWTERLCL